MGLGASYENKLHRQYIVEMIPSVIGCLGGGIKQLKSDLKELFDNEKEIEKTVYEMQKTGKRINYLKSIVRNSVDMRCYTFIFPYVKILYFDWLFLAH